MTQQETFAVRGVFLTEYTLCVLPSLTESQRRQDALNSCLPCQQVLFARLECFLTQDSDVVVTAGSQNEGSEFESSS